MRNAGQSLRVLPGRGRLIESGYTVGLLQPEQHNLPMKIRCDSLPHGFLLCLIAGAAYCPAQAEWLVGGLLQIEEAQYTDQTTAVEIIPYIAWENKRWHFGIDEISVDLSSRDDIQWGLVAEPRYGMDNHSERFESLQRDFALEAGLEAGISIYPWMILASAKHDVTGEHGGYLLELGLGQEIFWGGGELGFSLESSYRSDSLAMHLYGVGDTEATANLPAYEPGAVWKTSVSLDYLLPAGEQSAWLFKWQTSFLPGSVVASPRLDKATASEAYIAFVREF